MKLNTDNIDEAVLALLHLTSFTEKDFGIELTRAWKGHDWDALNRLHEKGLIGNPRGKAKSVAHRRRQRALRTPLSENVH